MDGEEQNLRKIRLGWKNKRYAKNRIDAHGEWWEVVKESGGTALIRSVKTGDLRWISLEDDEDFKVLE